MGRSKENGDKFAAILCLILTIQLILGDKNLTIPQKYKQSRA